MNDFTKKIYLLSWVALIIQLCAIPLFYIRISDTKTKIILPSKVHETCSQKECIETYKIEGLKKYFVLGHVIAKHKVIENNKELFPITISRSDSVESFANIYGYETQKNSNIIIKVKRPKNARLKGFIGFPIVTSKKKELLSLTSLVPILSTFSLITAIITLFTFFITYQLSLTNNQSSLDRFNKRFNTSILIFTTLNILFASHIFDSIFPNPYIRITILRSLGYISPLMIFFSYSKIRSYTLYFIIVTPILIIGVFFGRDTFFTIPNYLFLHLILGLAIVCAIAKTKNFFTYFACSLYIFDILRINGIHLIGTPPINLYIYSLYLVASKKFWDDGAKEIIPLLKKAYTNLRRDYLLLKILEIGTKIERNNTRQDFSRIIEMIVKFIPQFLGCEQVSLVISIPGEDPLTINSKNEKTTLIDDGRIDGIISTRVVLYGDSFSFKTIEELKIDRGELYKQKDNLKRYKYFCAHPLKYDNEVIGSIAATGFNDTQAETDLEYKEDFNKNISIIMDKLTTLISKKIHHNDEEINLTTKEIEKEIAESIIEHESEVDFLDNFTRLISNKLNRMAILFLRDEHKGNIQYHYNVSDKAKKLTETPLNLNSKEGNNSGPAVVAFNENKVSYLKNINEIESILHPKSIEFLRGSNIDEISCIPFKILSRSYVLMLMSNNTSEYKPYIPKLVNSLIPILTSGYISLLHKSSLKSFIPNSVLKKMMKGEELVEKDQGFLVMMDLKGSTAIANIITGQKWSSMIENERHNIQQVAESHGLALQKVVYDAFYFTITGGKDQIKRVLDFESSINKEITKFYSSNFSNLKGYTFPKGKFYRFCFVYGDTSRSLSSGQQKEWTITGNTMALVTKLESKAKDYSYDIYTTLESIEGNNKSFESTGDTIKGTDHQILFHKN